MCGGVVVVVVGGGGGLRDSVIWRGHGSLMFEALTHLVLRLRSRWARRR